MTKVDWCDAYAYCQGVGKRLCGKIGGGANGFDDYANATLSQWYNACSSGGAHNYPYGGAPQTGIADGYDAQKCNGAENGVGTAMPVATSPECISTESGYAGVYDLSGNVWEWEDSCSKASGSSDNCRLRGASFYGVAYMHCAIEYMLPRNFVTEYNGLRCCGP